MMKSLTNPAEINEYMTNLGSLLEFVNEFSSKNNRLSGLKRLIEYTSLLKFKIDNELQKELKINTATGLFSIGHFSNLDAEKNNLQLKLEFSFTPEEIRDRLIKEIDSHDVDNFDMRSLLHSLAKRHYLSLLEKTDIGEDITIKTNLAESGDSDLIKIMMEGYCSPLGAVVCSYDIDFYVNKNILGKRKKIKCTHTQVSLDEDLNNCFLGWFGIQSNMIYEFIRKQKGLAPRKVERSVFGPLYCQFFKADRLAKEIDPYYLQITADIIEKETHSYVLSIHTDTSTKHFDPSYQNDSETEKPNISIQHSYFCTDNGIAHKLEKYMPKHQINVIGCK